MKITPTELRSNLYKLLDQILETNQSIDIIRKGKVLKLSVAENPSDNHKLSNIKAHSHVIVGDPDDLIDIDWGAFWKGDLDL